MKKKNTDKQIANRRAMTAARQRKRNKAWRDKLQEAGWSESEYKTAVINGTIELQPKAQ